MGWGEEGNLALWLCSHVFQWNKNSFPAAISDQINTNTVKWAHALTAGSSHRSQLGMGLGCSRRQQQDEPMEEGSPVLPVGALAASNPSEADGATPARVSPMSGRGGPAPAIGASWQDYWHRIRENGGKDSLGESPSFKGPSDLR